MLFPCGFYLPFSNDYKLEKEMATHSSVLAWRIVGTGEPGGLPSMGLYRVGHDWSDLAAAAMIINVEHFHMLIGYLYIFFVEMSMWVFCPLYSQVFKICWVIGCFFFTYFEYWSLSRYMVYNYFLLFCVLPFHFVFFTCKNF